MPKLRTSERTTFTSCRQRWWWAWVENYRPLHDGPALRFGSLVHRAMELRYPPGIKRGPHPAETFERLYTEELEQETAMGFRDENENWVNAGEMGVALLNAFVDEYGTDDQWRVIASEQVFQVRVSKVLTYVGTFDGIWRNRSTGEIMLKEWKTTTEFWQKHLPLDEQAGSYWTFAPPWLRKHGILRPTQELAGILYTFMRRTMPDTRPLDQFGHRLNQDGSISKRQPKPLFERHVSLRSDYERQQVRRRVIEQAREMRMIKNGELSIWKAPSRTHCAGCPFLDPCELHEAGADYMPLLRAGYEKHNPYDAHEIKEEGKET